jgi:hypothetical protein
VNKFCHKKESLNLGNINVLEDLKRKANRVGWLKGARKDYFAILSRKGFTKRLREAAAKEGTLLKSVI